MLNWFPQALEVEPVVHQGAGRRLQRGERFSVLTWNLQYCASHRYVFFYDGGKTVQVPKAVVLETVAAVAQVLKQSDTDIILLQEVDRGANRTAGIDELMALQEQLKYPHWTGTPYHRSRFVPKPWPHPMGKVDLWLATLSRLELGQTRRMALPALQEPAWVARFNLKRAILETELPGGFFIANTHLSAFSNGDGTVPRQMTQVRDWLKTGGPRMIGGDFNALPPGDKPARLGRYAVEYSDASPPLEILREFTSAIPWDQLLAPENRSYLPPESVADARLGPDRVLDYLFCTDTVEVLSAEVLKIPAWISDHFPVRAECRLR
jgi:endonuclease/exonuclease/phosphatase family metal-dependent hydrolase